jgi:hypothetical protein
MIVDMIMLFRVSSISIVLAIKNMSAFPNTLLTLFGKKNSEITAKINIIIPIIIDCDKPIKIKAGIINVGL